MSLLSYDQLVLLVARGVITNVTENMINASSIDLTLGKTLLVEHVEPNQRHTLGLNNGAQLRTRTVDLNASGCYDMAPGEFLLAHSVQMFHMPLNLSAEYKLKSSMARIGLEHLTAGWIDAGFHNSVLTLELKNMTRGHYIRLRPGDRIGQVTFLQHEAVDYQRSYAARGRYNHDRTVKGAKPTEQPPK